MKRFIVKKQQLIEYVEKKKSDKVFYNILEHLNKNVSLLTENVSHTKANQSVIDDYLRKNLITKEVAEMLIKHKITDETGQII
jgi:hypothetical protein